MQKQVVIIVPGEPVPQERAGEEIRYNDKAPISTTTTRTTARPKKKAIKLVARTALARARITEPISGAVSITVQAFRRIPKGFSEAARSKAEAGLIVPITKPDAKNYLWLVEDALNGLAYVDDARIVDAACYKRYSREPRTEITLTIWEGGGR